MENQIIIDSHVHLDLIYKYNNEMIQWMKQVRYIPVSWAYGENIESIDDLKKYLKNQEDIVEKMNDNGLKSFCLSGIHPRNISDDLKPEHVKELIMPFLDNPYCLGFGEIGLETGTQKEKEIFEAHLEMGKEIMERDKCIGIHTPRDNKKDIADNIFDVLEKYTGLESIIVIDHCNKDIIEKVLAKGFWAGISLSSIKTSFAQLSEILEKHPDKTDKIMCNTDSGTLFYKDFYKFANSKDFSPEIRQSLACDNAAIFFGMIF